MPHMTVASDSMWNNETDWDMPVKKYVEHPRTSGTHGTVLALGRKYNVPLMFSLAQMSYWPAKHLGDTGLKAMQERGRMQVGMMADITIFDPLKAKAESTYKQGEQGKPSSGIPYVIVNGQVVVKDSKFQKVWAGQPIRFPVEARGCFDPIAIARFFARNAISVPAIDNRSAGPQRAGAKGARHQ